ncbi:hypothetical protein RBH29_09435 [Herbivorax sp. ANBcel31]|uniref:hypothetical protein n=1 Tax=Herbivorax sp. ANBcel31 TaxID=3069754 RepID=UPI0027AE54CA|nr:hypothetical protein [Herbivorax sp. ANBcel31]MDQ2086645.1 hypothetical protein [Herbivorax sp. ANBcel31]
MKAPELMEYLRKITDYIEYSFFQNSTEIMEAIQNKGFENVLEILSLKEIKKGVYICDTVWNVDEDKSFKKNVNIDITDEMIFITEVI